MTDTPEPPRFDGRAEHPAGGPAPDRPGPPRRRRWRRWAAVGAAGVVLAGAGAGWALYAKLSSNIHTDSATERELRKWESERPPAGPPNAQNLLLIGSDSRQGGNGKYGRGRGQRSDTTILLHLAADRKSATAVSIPRDLMVTVPHCKRADGTESAPQTAQFNWAFAFGGAACAIRTAERTTRIRIDHYMIIDFVGFKKMVDAVDGVEVCLPQPVRDDEAHLRLPAGRQTLHGEAALGYVRARKSLGNGSDTQRMERQQRFLGALVKKVQSNGVLLNPTRLYPVLDAATSSLTTDPGLASLRGLYELVRSTRGIPTERVQFLTVPRQEYRYDPNRDELVQPDAGRLFGQLRSDLPVTVKPTRHTGEEPLRAGSGSPDDKPAASPAPSASSGPTFPGTTAEHGICE
ncbi:LCP family protein [Streptomyces sp. NPDC048595]|uniref:LCP family protein n=1 Tax=Streptomyces sp. NPDC048595 TaxID=3365576 RepID=UPI0037131A02